MARDEERVHSISSLPRSRAEDQRQRMRSYTISMTIRTVCFLLAGLFVTVVPWQPGAWLCILAALVLPYPAVVVANNRDMRQNVEQHEPVVHRMLTAEAGTHDWDRPAQDPAPTVPVEPVPTVVVGTTKDDRSGDAAL